MSVGASVLLGLIGCGWLAISVAGIRWRIRDTRRRRAEWVADGLEPGFADFQPMMDGWHDFNMVMVPGICLATPLAVMVIICDALGYFG